MIMNMYILILYILIYFIINLFKRILYSISIVKKEWKGFKGKTTVWTVHAISRYFFTFFNFLCKNICFFQTDFVYLVIERLRKNNWRFFKDFLTFLKYQTIYIKQDWKRSDHFKRTDIYKLTFERSFWSSGSGRPIQRFRSFFNNDH